MINVMVQPRYAHANQTSSIQSQMATCSAMCSRHPRTSSQGADDDDDDDSIVMCVVAKSERVTRMSDIREICYYALPAIVRDASADAFVPRLLLRVRESRGVATDAYTNVDFGRRGRLGLCRYLRRPKRTARSGEVVGAEN